MTRHVLIGSGPGSLSAALEIRALDPSAEITVVTSDADAYYSRPGLAYHLVREVRERELYPLRPAEIRAARIAFVFRRAEAIDRGAGTVVLDDGRALPYDRLLLATGSTAIPLGMAGTELDGVVKLDDLHDTRELIARSRAGGCAVVVGGGSTAIEIVEGLNARGMRVHYFMRKARYWSDVLSETESRRVEQGLTDSGVVLHHFTEIAEVLGRDGRVGGVRTNDGTELPCALVAVAIGVRPQVKLACDAGIECGRAVLVDEYLRSSDEAVFAAGDVAEAIEPRTGKRTLEVLWNSAVAKGRVAGRNMVQGPVERYTPSVPVNVTRLAGYHITILGTVGVGRDSDLKGLARGDAEGWRRESPGATTIEWEDEACHVRLALEGDRLAGAVVVGEQDLSFALQDLLEAGGDASAIADDLRAPNADIGAIIRRFSAEGQASRG